MQDPSSLPAAPPSLKRRSHTVDPALLMAAPQRQNSTVPAIPSLSATRIPSLNATRNPSLNDYAMRTHSMRLSSLSPEWRRQDTELHVGSTAAAGPAVPLVTMPDEQEHRPSVFGKTLEEFKSVVNSVKLPPGEIFVPDNWWSSLIFFRGSVIKQIKWRILVIMLFSLLLNILQYNRISFTPLSVMAHTLLGTALGLLLVFRTNVSYDRYWEGRKMWAQVTHQARTLTRLLVGLPYVTQETGDHVGNLVIAYAHLLKTRLRIASHAEDDEEEARAFLRPKTMSMLEQLSDRPAAVLQLISRHMFTLWKQGKLSPFQFSLMVAPLTAFHDSQVACERIISTPTPFPFLVQMRQLLFLYLISLPLVFQSLYPTWVSLCACFLLAFGLLGIEAAGQVVENPFGKDEADLPLDRYVLTIEENVASQLNLQMFLVDYQADDDDE